MRRLAAAIVIAALTSTAACAPTSSARAPGSTSAVAAVSTGGSVAPTTVIEASPAAGERSSGVLPTASEIASGNSGWSLYADPAQGFEFRYPPACRVTQAGDDISVGSRIELAVQDTTGLPLPAFVDGFVDERTRAGGWTLDTRSPESVQANQAIRIEYRFGGSGRYGTALFVEHKGRMYIWNFTAGAFSCDEPDIYPDIVASFRFVD